MLGKATIVASPPRFLEVALKKTGPLSLSYVHADLKLVIREHILNLVQEHPNLTIRAETFTYDDGFTANLLNVSGVLPLKRLARSSSFPAEIHVVIWLHPRYPIDPPSVHVSLTTAAAAFCATAQAPLAITHPFVDPTTGAVTTPYLLKWTDPSFWSVPDLSQLVRNLINIFTYWPPFPFFLPPPPAAEASLASRKEATDRLSMALLCDLSRLIVDVQEDVRRLVPAQARLKDRAAACDFVASASNKELNQLRQEVQRVNARVNDLEEWLKRMDESQFPDHAPEEVFLPVDAESKWKLDNRSGYHTIDDLIHLLDKAAQNKAVPARSYLKHVRALAREQAAFVHREAVPALFTLDAETRTSSSHQ